MQNHGVNVFKVATFLLREQHTIVEENHPVVRAFVLDRRQFAFFHNIAGGEEWREARINYHDIHIERDNV